jgi:hypothetical protein
MELPGEKRQPFGFKVQAHLTVVNLEVTPTTVLNKAAR